MQVVLQPVAFFFGARDTDDFRSGEFAELADDGACGSCCAGDDEGFACFDLADVVETLDELSSAQY